MWRRLQCRQCENDDGLQEKSGHLEWSMRFVPTYTVSTDDAETMAAMVKLAEETDESASDVVVYGMVR